jgi:hypothetical protein
MVTHQPCVESVDEVMIEIAEIVEEFVDVMESFVLEPDPCVGYLGGGDDDVFVDACSDAFQVSKGLFKVRNKKPKVEKSGSVGGLVDPGVCMPLLTLLLMYMKHFVQSPVTACAYNMIMLLGMILSGGLCIDYGRVSLGPWCSFAVFCAMTGIKFTPWGCLTRRCRRWWMLWNYADTLSGRSARKRRSPMVANTGPPISGGIKGVFMVLIIMWVSMRHVAAVQESYLVPPLSRIHLFDNHMPQFTRVSHPHPTLHGHHVCCPTVVYEFSPLGEMEELQAFERDPEYGWCYGNHPNA